MHPFRAAGNFRSDGIHNKRSHQQQSNQHNSYGNSDDNYSPQGNNQQFRNQHHRNAKKKDFAASYYVYGKSAAIEFVCDETKKQRINTISLQAATAKPHEERGYDWDSKTVIQIPRNELLVVTAILLGFLRHGEFRQNGLHASKSYTVEHQQKKIFVMVMERGKPIRAVGLSPEDSYQVTQLFLKQLHANSPWMTVSEIIDLIEMTVVRMKNAHGNDADDEDQSDESMAAYDAMNNDDEEEEAFFDGPDSQLDFIVPEPTETY